MKIDINQLRFYHVKLRRLLIWLEKDTGLEFTITSQFRMKDPGVHGTLPLRGTDLRMRDKKTGKSLEDLINKTWKYDFQRPRKKCAVLHGEGSFLHLHIQVHPLTQRK